MVFLGLRWIRSHRNLDVNIIIIDSFSGTVVFFLGFSKDCNLVLILTKVSILFVVFGIDKGLVLIISCVEALIPPLVTYGFLFTGRGGVMNFMLVYR